MCTAATYRTDDFYMGRTLDYEFSYGEEITVMPRNFPLSFRHGGGTDRHYAIIGMAHVADGYPMFYDAVNEKGLGMAGLNFAASARYSEPEDGKQNVAQFEFIPWVLSQFASLEQARSAIEKINLVGTTYDSRYPAAKMHWIIADKSGAITVEPTEGGLKIYDNAPGVLTNEPPFDMQLFNLNNYMRLSPRQPENSFSDALDLGTYSRGMGGLGLPGDLSSMSRFVRAAFTKLNSLSGSGEAESVGQFFHILGSVEQVRGCCEVAQDKYEITIYTSCFNADKGVYYYTTYNNRRITAVDMHRENLDSDSLARYPMLDKEDVLRQN
ncbi:MAG TPA: choloylglycine hydrolase [Ruminococcaceae bacterium]|nr:choloylglycine hydrolase [Oscillospiraceae bacterium]